jgi:hypothetical protein
VADAALPAAPPRRAPAWLGAAGLVVAVPLAAVLLPMPAAVVLLAAAIGSRLVRVPERWLAVFTWGLPFHTLAVMTLFAVVRVPAGPLRAIAAWKELTVIAVTAGVVGIAATRRGPRSPVAASDLMVGGLIALAMVHVAVEAAAVGGITPAVVTFGLRDSILFMLLYFVGRATPAIAADDRALERIFLVGVVTAIAGVVERFFVPPNVLALAGVAAYYREFLNVGSFLMEGSDLPINLFTWMGGRTVRRMGSVYLSGQGFAVPMIIIIPAATALLLDTRRRRSAVAWVCYALLWFGLLATITRTTIVTCFVQAALLSLLLWRPWLVSAGAVVAAIGAGLALVAVPQVADFVWETLTWQSASSLTHASDFERGLSSLLEYPWGRGLGTADLTAVRLGRPSISGDNLFLKYGVELGWPGLLLHAAVLLSVLFAASRVWAAGESTTVRRFGAVVLAITVGVLVNGGTGVVYNNHVVSFLFFWLAGTTVTLAQRLAPAAVPPPA